VVETGDENAVLTDRQRDCLGVTLREGYFEVPRECTLAEVADAVGIDKSTASEILRRGESRVLKRFLLGPD
jgi:predicted DNA binding protein